MRAQLSSIDAPSVDIHGAITGDRTIDFIQVDAERYTKSH